MRSIFSVLLLGIAFNCFSQNIYNNFGVMIPHSSVVIGSSYGYGGINVNIENDRLIIHFGVYTNGGQLKIGNIATLSTSPVLPDINLGYLRRNDGQKLHLVSIENGTLVISGPSGYTYPSISEDFIIPLPYLEGFSPEMNFKSETTFKDKFNLEQLNGTLEEGLTNVTYYDEFGRIDQEVVVDVSSGVDLVSKQEYEQGKLVKSYFPYGRTTSIKGLYDANFEQAHDGYYHDFFNEQTAFATTIYSSQFEQESIKEHGGGDLWSFSSQANDFTDNSVKKSHRLNTSSDKVIKWIIDSVYSVYGVLHKGYHSQGSLHVSEIYDENNNKNIQFLDSYGRIILERTVVGVNIFEDTYHIYDVYGRKVFTLSPEFARHYTSDLEDLNIDYQLVEGNEQKSAYEGVNYLVTKGKSLTLKPGFVFSATSTSKFSIGSIDLAGLVDMFAYQYQYDDRNNLIQRKMPGADWEYFVYDKWDRLSMYQSAHLRNDYSSPKWKVIKYDAFNRIAYEAFVTTSKTLTELRTLAFSNTLSRYEITSFSGNKYELGYSLNNSFPNSSVGIIMALSDITVAYFYDYAFIASLPVNDKLVYQPDFSGLAYLSGLSNHSTPCGKLVKDERSGMLLYEIDYFDENYRIIQSHKQYSPAYSVRKSYLNDFAGSPLKIKTTLLNNTISEQSVLEMFSYDNRGKLEKHYHSITRNNIVGPNILLASYTYDDLGRVIKEQLHSNDNGNTFLQSLDYAYDVRGNLLSLNNFDEKETGSGAFNESGDIFGYKLNRNSQVMHTSVDRQFNGNIAEASFLYKSLGGADYKPLVIGYRYDKGKRLIESQFYQLNQSLAYERVVDGVSYEEKMTYDKNGNILTISRTGEGGDANGYIDDLVLLYRGNQLVEVQDKVVSSAGYNDRSKTGSDFTYNSSGYLISDKDQLIVGISYNELNLHKQIRYSNNIISDFFYDGLGRKTSSEVSRMGGIVETFYYDIFYWEELNDDVQNQKIFTAKGVFEVSNSNYQYHIRDYLGNLLVAFDKDPATGGARIIQEEMYYPFGMSAQSYTSGIRSEFLFNNKERLSSTSDFYDFGARLYHPGINRWMAIDPLADITPGVSPYKFGMNNPLRFTDPNGLYDYDEFMSSDLSPESLADNVYTERELFFMRANSRPKPSSNGVTALRQKMANIEQNGGAKWELIPTSGYEKKYGQKGGVNARIGVYVPNADKYSSFNWIQTIYTNKPRLGEKGSYVDGTPNSLPFYWTKETARDYANASKYDMIFDDSPSRYLDEGFTFWRAELSLMGEVHGSYERIMTITYGFMINSSGQLTTYTPVNWTPSTTHLNHLNLVK